MRIIHVERTAEGRDTHLVVDDVYRPRYLIAQRPQVLRATGETLVVWVVALFAVERRHRRAVAWCQTLRDAEAWCRAELETPDLATPKTSGLYGSAVPPGLQQERWTRGLDPLTGAPREA